MSDERNQPGNRIVSSIIGYLLLVPPVVSVFLFLARLIDPRKFMFILWTGDHALYVGLMAIAGAYLIKGNRYIL
jgi:hypothetical protein